MRKGANIKNWDYLTAAEITRSELGKNPQNSEFKIIHTYLSNLNIFSSNTVPFLLLLKRRRKQAFPLPMMELIPSIMSVFTELPPIHFCCVHVSDSNAINKSGLFSSDKWKSCKFIDTIAPGSPYGWWDRVSFEWTQKKHIFTPVRPRLISLLIAL